MGLERQIALFSIGGTTIKKANGKSLKFRMPIFYITCAVSYIYVLAVIFMSISNFIKHLFRPSSDSKISQTSMSIKDAYDDPNTFDFNEDYYRQIEFLPRENFDNVSKTTKEIAEFAEANFDGYGWPRSFVRNKVDFPTRNRGIPSMEIEALLCEKKYFEFKRVTKSQSTTAIVQRDTKAFKNNSIVICFNYKDDILENMWLNLSPRDVDYPEYEEILMIFGKKYSFFLADWWKSRIVDISNPSEIEDYFKFE